MPSAAPASVRAPNQGLLLQPEDIVTLTAEEAARDIDMFMTALTAEENTAQARGATAPLERRRGTDEHHGRGERENDNGSSRPDGTTG